MFRTRWIGKGQDAFGSRAFEVNDNGVKTQVYVIQGIDLIVKQAKDGKEIYLSHYSSPGFHFYSCLLKFMAANGMPLPKPLPVSGTASDEVEREARDSARMIAETAFPLRYYYHHGAKEGAIVQPVYLEGSSGSLEITLGKETIYLSSKTIAALARGIPKLYPHTKGFVNILHAFTAEAAKHKPIKPVPRIRGKKTRQLQFDFTRMPRKGRNGRK